MFTGIIEEIGQVKRLEAGAGQFRLTVGAATILEDVHLGDSIAINGACLTVVAFGGDHFTVDVSPETLTKTTTEALKPGDPVNLERAMAAGGRFGGHMVSGHVDGVGMLKEKARDGNAWVLTFSAPREILDLSVPKGSIAIDGISLTLNTLGADSFSVTVIPHTAQMTTLEKKGTGTAVNLEGDLIGKYVHRILERMGGGEKMKGRSLDLGFLSEHGFA
ncbi:MAG: riboflavin synthase [bacterium]|nr:riboflavin synthase [bacterium]